MRFRTMKRQSPWVVCLGLALLVACGPTDPESKVEGHGPIADGIMAPLGDPIPTASPEQLETFARGLKVAKHRFTREEGLGPAFNLTFCAGCHEKPAIGGSAGLYRNFFLAAKRLPDGAYLPATSAGKSGGVIRMYDYAPGRPSRPEVDPEVNIIAQRNAIPFFGVGLLAAITNDEILKRVDPDDRNGDGISGRANWDRGFVGRFGRKAQTVSIEGFIRGPLFNHLGITTVPLTDEQRAKLPVDSSGGSKTSADAGLANDPLIRSAQLRRALAALGRHAQAAAPDAPNSDDDGVPDPEMSPQDLFDLVSYAMLLAAPKIEPETEQTARGREIFDSVGCGGCHTPRLKAPRGMLPVYSDLLLHDMGPELADGLEQGLAKGYEFRTQPLWGIAAVGPYLHDGRAGTIREAILAHGGEGQRARDKVAALDEADYADLEAFLLSLGGRDQVSPGLIPPGTPIGEVGSYGGPARALDAKEQAAFLAGREEFDREHSYGVGAGAPRMNGDSCRACHFEPAVGGAGPRGVNVMRHGLVGKDGGFVVPAIGTILHKSTRLRGSVNAPQSETAIFEHRQTPHLFGLGLIDAIAPETIIAGADPDDANGDGIRGRVSWVDGGRVGRFGWKGQVPSIAEFVRDGIAMELGMTLPFVPGLTFGLLQDDDGVADPELDTVVADRIAFYLAELAPPPRSSSDAAAEAAGEKVFAEIGCASCHTPSLPSGRGPVALYSDLLLHTILPEGALGIEEASAGMRDFRTAPLWGLAHSGPYWHTGEADTIEQAIELHDGEAVPSRESYKALSDTTRGHLLAFLRSL